jgi:hypothetical protein
MKCHITSALQLSAQDFRVLRALEAVLNKKGSARLNDNMIILEAVTFLYEKRPDIKPVYTRKIVEDSHQRLVTVGLVRERNLELTSCGKKIVEMTMESNDPLFENHQKWSSSQKSNTRSGKKMPKGVAVAV